MGNSPALKLMLVGDLILDEPEPDSFFDPARGTLKEADLLVGHIEVPNVSNGRAGGGNCSALNRTPIIRHTPFILRHGMR